MTDAAKPLWFITMRATGETTQFDWFRHIEELRAAIWNEGDLNDWSRFEVYGPTGSEALPAICIRVQLSAQEIGNILEYVARNAAWMSLPIECYRAMPVGE